MNAIPKGYRVNAAGHLVPEEQIRELDKLRDELVIQLIDGARHVQNTLRGFKRAGQEQIRAFVELAALDYGATLGGDKGNISLSSFDGRYKVEVNVADRQVFDEKLLVAKALIDDCIHRWTDGSRSEVKALIEHAFQTDAAGKLNYGRIFSLMRLPIEDEGWTRAMKALRDSIQVVGTKSYLRFYERLAKDQPYRALPLDIAAV
jgi:hypothetical protein